MKSSHAMDVFVTWRLWFSKHYHKQVSSLRIENTEHWPASADIPLLAAFANRNSFSASGSGRAPQGRRDSLMNCHSKSSLSVHAHSWIVKPNPGGGVFFEGFSHALNTFRKIDQSVMIVWSQNQHAHENPPFVSRCRDSTLSIGTPLRRNVTARTHK